MRLTSLTLAALTFSSRAVSLTPRPSSNARRMRSMSNRSQLRPPFRAQSRPLLGLIELRGMAFAGVGRLWVSGLPERPSRVWRRQATYPQRTARAWGGEVSFGS